MSSLSVVIATFDDNHRLKLTLPGYALQSDPEFTIYVVNDGGPPDTEELVKAFEGRLDIRYGFLGPPSPEIRQAAAKNLAVRQVSEDRILLSDCDTVPSRTLVAGHKKYGSDRVIVCGVRKHVDRYLAEKLTSSDVTDLTSIAVSPDERIANPDLFSAFTAMLWPNQTIPELCYGCNVSHPTRMVKNIGGFWEEITGWGGDDVEIAERLCKLGCTTLLDPFLEVYHLDHPDSTPPQQRGFEKWLARSHALPTLIRNGGPIQ